MSVLKSVTTNRGCIYSWPHALSQRSWDFG